MRSVAPVVLAASLGVLLAEPHASAGLAQDPSGPAPSVVLVVTYVDGRQTPLRVGARCGAWTPMFPRLREWTPPPNEVPVSAINYACEQTREGVRVVVSVFRGSPRQSEQPIATVLVTPGKPVVVEQLRAVGIAPVTLTVTTMTTPEVIAPKARTASAQLEVVDVTVTQAPAPRIRVLLRNRSLKAVRSIAIQSTRGGLLSQSARRVGREGDALIPPASDFVLDWAVPLASPAADGSVSASAIDLIDIVAVVWSDGTFEGNLQGVHSLVSDYVDRWQLGLVLAALQRPTEGGTPQASELRSALESLSITDTPALISDIQSRVPGAVSMQRGDVASLVRVSLTGVRKMALDDLARFETAPPGAGSLADWLATTIDRYRRWFDRLGALKPKAPDVFTS
jgi:hypothetical protein